MELFNIPVNSMDNSLLVPNFFIWSTEHFATAEQLNYLQTLLCLAQL